MQSPFQFFVVGYNSVGIIISCTCKCAVGLSWTYNKDLRSRQYDVLTSLLQMKCLDPFTKQDFFLSNMLIELSVTILFNQLPQLPLLPSQHDKRLELKKRQNVKGQFLN